MKRTKRNIKFRKNNSKKYKYNKKNSNKKREKKIYYKKLNKTKRLKGGVRESSRTRRAPERLLDVTSKEFEKEQRRREKEKKALIEKKRNERIEQEKINKVENDPINKKILDKPVSDKDITVILVDNDSPSTNNKLKVNFRDIIVWKAISEIKKRIQKDFLEKNMQISQNQLNKYGVLHKEIFKEEFQKYIKQLEIFTFEQIKDLNTKLDNNLDKYLKEEGTIIAKYPGVLSYIKNAFDEFKEYIFPESKIIKDYSLFSYLVNYYYNIEFGSKMNDFGIRFNNKVKERVKSLKNELDKNKFITDYPEYQDILKKYNKLNGTDLKNSDLIYDENYIGYQLTDKDITDILSTDELREYASRDEEELRELIQKTDELRKFDDRRESSSLRSNRGSDDDY